MKNNQNADSEQLACFATRRITVDGAKIGYMYREEPVFLNDSGWRFFAGDETKDYLDNSQNIKIYDLNTVTKNYPEVIPFLDADIDSVVERNSKTGKLSKVTD